MLVLSLILIASVGVPKRAVNGLETKEAIDSQYPDKDPDILVE
jgi:hypothetical protein